MKSISELVNQKKYQPEKKETNWYKQLGKEMTEYFGKNCYWIPYRYEQWKIRQAFKTMQDLDKKEFGYFLGILKNI